MLEQLPQNGTSEAMYTNKLSCKSKTPFADYPQYGKHPHQFYAQLINNKTVKNLHRQINGHCKNNINVILVS